MKWHYLVGFQSIIEVLMQCNIQGHREHLRNLLQFHTITLQPTLQVMLCSIFFWDSSRKIESELYRSFCSYVLCHKKFFRVELANSWSSKNVLNAGVGCFTILAGYLHCAVRPVTIIDFSVHIVLHISYRLPDMTLDMTQRKLAKSGLAVYCMLSNEWL